ncbi:MAG: hypothetical protein F9K13_00370 [Candidatus Methylomirabilis oxygeniifera]|uniref:Uncharacterized protein n=1 Tax=Methylomirabilis oxygeniifera TaxID=671143 RepID=D5MI73_METO1|nr:MAG: hypothetical protein F9K13_00370 [Candidatus Methylomirabilis oxyfera]CBE67223.1 protein of unknown function [Candidatus Methylomirabilis oxyfera]
MADMIDMARKPRIHDPGASSHVVSRGNQGRPIFRDAADCQHYLPLLQAGVGREVGDLTMHAMAGMLGHDPGGLSRGLQRLVEEMTRDPDL